MEDFAKPCADCGAPVAELSAYLGYGGSLCSSCTAIRIRSEEEARDSVACARCGRVTRQWTRETWRNGVEYCVECLKELEAVWRAENCCMACGAPVEDWGARVFPPERIQARDEFVKAGKVAKRFVCRKCFEAMTRKKFGVFVARSLNARTPLLRRMSSLLGVGGG